jgi:hypothetical protein
MESEQDSNKSVRNSPKARKIEKIKMGFKQTTPKKRHNAKNKSLMTKKDHLDRLLQFVLCPQKLLLGLTDRQLRSQQLLVVRFGQMTGNLFLGLSWTVQ